MMRRDSSRLIRFLPLLLLVCALVCGCSKPDSEPTIGLEIYPAEMHGAVAGETRVLLVRLLPDETSPGESDVRYPLQIECPGVRIEHAPETLALAEVGEIHVIPNPESVGRDVELAVTTVPEGPSASAQIHVSDVVPERNVESIVRYASRAREVFAVWLQKEHPDLGITFSTQWTALPIRTAHEPPPYYCLLQSEEWEMTIWWRGYQPGSVFEWVRMALRHRATEFTPSLAAKVNSLRYVSRYPVPEPMIIPENPVR